MRERVKTIIGSSPIILVAPHGADDINTSIITEVAAKITNAYAVINQGFERAENVDEEKDLANCNKVNHCKEPIIYEEFLKPIIKFKTQILNKLNRNGIQFNTPVTIFYIHGCGNIVHKEAGEDVSLIVGFGLGNKKDSFTCEIWRKNLFIDSYRKFNFNGEVYEGKKGGKYSGRDSNNMNQYFKKHELDILVDSLQLEFPFSVRSNDADATTTGLKLASAIDNYMKHKSYSKSHVQKLI